MKEERNLQVGHWTAEAFGYALLALTMQVKAVIELLEARMKEERNQQVGYWTVKAFVDGLLVLTMQVKAGIELLEA